MVGSLDFVKISCWERAGSEPQKVLGVQEPQEIFLNKEEPKHSPCVSS